jgi:hypothetical protein
MGWKTAAIPSSMKIFPVSIHFGPSRSNTIQSEVAIIKAPNGMVTITIFSRNLR